MARTDTLPHFLADVAQAIRDRDGSTGSIAANTFDTRIRNIAGYALSGTWKLTASTVYSKKQNSTLTASNANVCLQFGDDGVFEGVGLTFDSTGMKIGSTVVFSYYEYTTYGKGWRGLNASTYPTAYLEFNQACSVSEAFYNYFTSVATQTSGGGGGATQAYRHELNFYAYDYNEETEVGSRTTTCQISYINTNSGNESIDFQSSLSQTEINRLVGKDIIFDGWMTTTITSIGEQDFNSIDTSNGMCLVVDTSSAFTDTVTEISGTSAFVSTGTLQLNAVPGASQIWVPKLSGGLVTYGRYTSGHQEISNVIMNVPFYIYMGLDSAPYIYKDTSGVLDIGSDLNDAGYYVGILTSSSGSVRFWYDCCFDSQSKVLMADSTEKALVDIAIGDIVMTYDEITGASATNEVTALGTVKLTNITELTLEDGIVIRMNVYHPMWTEEGWKSIVGYKGMPRLTAEDKLLNNNGEYVAIKSIEEVEIDTTTYYTLKVANNNNFYVNGYLAQGKDKD